MKSTYKIDPPDLKGLSHLYSVYMGWLRSVGSIKL